MKFTRIKALCKAEHCCIIYNQGGRDLIGTRNAAYPAEEIAITARSVSVLFDWPDVEEDIPIEVVQMERSRLNPVSEYKNQLIELHPGWAITYIDEVIVPLVYEHGMVFVEQAYIAAAKKTEGYTSYHLSENIDGEPLVVIGDGLITTAIVKPMNRKTAEGIRNYLRSVSDLVAFGWPDEEKTAEESGAMLGQVNMDEMLEEKDDGNQTD